MGWELSGFQVGSSIVSKGSDTMKTLSRIRKSVNVKVFTKEGGTARETTAWPATKKFKKLSFWNDCSME